MDGAILHRKSGKVVKMQRITDFDGNPLGQMKWGNEWILDFGC
jgi:hypothetical protein